MVEIKEVVRLWRAGIKKKRIASQLTLDVKTVRRYIAAAEGCGLAPGPSRWRLQRMQDSADHLVGELAAGTEPDALCGRDVAPHGLYVQRELGGDPLLLGSAHPEPEHFFDLDHRDLAVRHRPKVEGRSVTRR